MTVARSACYSLNGSIPKCARRACEAVPSASTGCYQLAGSKASPDFANLSQYAPFQVQSFKFTCAKALIWQQCGRLGDSTVPPYQPFPDGFTFPACLLRSHPSCFCAARAPLRRAFPARRDVFASPKNVSIACY